jgi:hypothetical protein
VLNALSEFQNQLTGIKSALANEDYPTLEATLNRSRSAYQILIGN